MNDDFKPKREHIELLKQGYFVFMDNVEFGFCGLDPKKPFGNSDAISDMAEILGYQEYTNGDMSDKKATELEGYLLNLYMELPKAIAYIVREYKCDEIEAGKRCEAIDPIANSREK